MNTEVGKWDDSLSCRLTPFFGDTAEAHYDLGWEESEDNRKNLIGEGINAAIFDEFASALLQFDVVNFCHHAAGGTHFFRLCVVAHGGDIDSVDYKQRQEEQLVVVRAVAVY
jgi:hypothetical protein